MAINSNLTLLERLEKIQDGVTYMEEILGKGLDQPFNCSNSGARKILYSTQKDHVVPVIGAQPPFVQTGYENKFGDKSSSIITAYQDMQVVAIIPKFSFAPNIHYFMIFKGENGKYNVYERCSYEHTSETYGYLYDNKFVDSLNVGDTIYKGDTIRSSMSYDEYGNRQDGVNLICQYFATDKTMEDSVILSDEAAYALGTHLIKRVTILFNINDVPLNLYGDETTYKSFPDIGEEVKKGITCGVRRENKEQFLYSLSYNRLNNVMMSDDKFTVRGKVVDIDIYSNNNESLDSFYNNQLKKYNEERKRFCSEVIQACETIKRNDPYAQFEYELEKLEFVSKQVVNGAQYIKEKNGKVFTGTIIDMIIIEEESVSIGDKVSDRYGGKGVVSYILPQHLMPKDDIGRYADAIINQSTCVNRENPGQLMEISLNHINARVIDSIIHGDKDTDESLDMIIEFLSCVSPQEALSLAIYLDSIDEESRELFLESICNDELVYTSLRPITDNLTLDNIMAIYDHFPWIGQSYLTVPIEDSNGNIRYVKSRRPIISGHKYMFRLKQYADEKSSSTSLASTNLRNLNTRSKNSKNYKSLHSNTPIAQGTMETDDQAHVGQEYVISNLMIHSVSPHARRRVEEMLTGDPFDIDIQIDENSRNRNAEILNTYLKAKGQRLLFEKIRREEPKPFIKWNEEKEEKEPKSFIVWQENNK